MTTDWIRIGSDWLQLIAAGVCGGALAWWASVGRRDRALSAQITALSAHIDERLADRDVRLTRLEGEQAHLPRSSACAAHLERVGRLEEQTRHFAGQRELGEIYGVINPLRESVAGLRADVQGIGESMRDIRTGLASLTDSLLRRDEGRRP